MVRDIESLIKHKIELTGNVLSGARIEMVEPNYAVVMTETYDVLCVCKTLDEALRVYDKYEEEDLENDEYEQNFYSIIDMSTEQIIY